MKQKNTSWDKEKLFLPVLIIISILSHFPFILEGIGEPDSARIATIVVDRTINGASGPLENLYHTDTIPLYILYLTWCMKILKHNFSYLPMVMNYTNGVFASLVIIPSYLFVRRLFGNSEVAFFSVLAFIFSPIFFNSSIYGAPHLIAISFFITSICFYLMWLDNNDAKRYLYLALSSTAFMLTILFKASIILGSLIFLGLLYLRGIKNKQKIVVSIFSLGTAFILFLLIRQQIIPPSGESITSNAGLTAYIKYFFISPDIGIIIRQVKPAILGAGLITSLTGIIAFCWYLLNKRGSMLVFILSWALIPNLYWILIWGNNARHHLIGVLPLLVMIILFFNEKAPRFTGLLTAFLILGNFFMISPSYSTYFPSGNLFKSQEMLAYQTNLYHSKAREIAGLDEEKIAVMGYFHNPYVYYEIVSSNPLYEAELLTSVRSSVVSIKAADKEFMICYVGPDNLEEDIDNAITKYGLENHVFVSTVHDLEWLNDRGIRTYDAGKMDSYHVGSFKQILAIFKFID